MNKIYTSCPQCSGTGVESVSSTIGGESGSENITCRTCEGDKVISSLFLNPDLLTLLNDMNDKINDIQEKVNA